MPFCHFEKKSCLTWFYRFYIWIVCFWRFEFLTAGVSTLISSFWGVTNCLTDTHQRFKKFYFCFFRIEKWLVYGPYFCRAICDFSPDRICNFKIHQMKPIPRITEFHWMERTRRRLCGIFLGTVSDCGQDFLELCFDLWCFIRICRYKCMQGCEICGICRK